MSEFTMSFHEDKVYTEQTKQTDVPIFSWALYIFHKMNHYQVVKNL
jgi:hypothetical protein